MSKVFVVGTYIAETPEGRVWNIEGVFSTQALAEGACVQRENFVGPLDLDERLPVETVPWKDAYFPLAEQGDIVSC